jgi:hypothetical protein
MGRTVPPTRKPTDRRAERRRDQRRLVAIVIGFLTVGGALAIAITYGAAPAVLGLACLVAGAAVLLLIWAILGIIERIAE